MQPIQFLAVVPDIQSAITIAGDGAARIKLDTAASELPQVVMMLGMTGQRLRVRVEVDENLPPQPPPEDKESEVGDQKPFGEQAALLYKHGFFYVPDVLEAIGTDEEFLAWVRTQPCALTGGFDKNTDKNGNEVMGCEAAHVSRIEYGRGASHKPPYAAIPLIHEWHAKHHQFGESIFADGDAEKGRAWMEKRRAQYVRLWASAKLARLLFPGYTSMGWVPPAKVVEWASLNNVVKYLPLEYMRAAAKEEASGA